MRRIETAVVASAVFSTQKHLSALLADSGIRLLASAQDGLTAWNLLEAHKPDLLLVDQALPALDGTLLARRALCSFALPVRPAVLLMHHPGFLLPDASLFEQSGAALLEKPLQAEAFAAVIHRLRSAELYFQAEEHARVDALLDALGVPRHPGRDCLRCAALLCATDIRAAHSLAARVYPAVGERCGLRPQQVERAMRHVISLAWQSEQVDNQYRIFADTIDAGRGQPTCREMISRLADILRLEG